jgi:hypothetical protein
MLVDWLRQVFPPLMPPAKGLVERDDALSGLRLGEDG